MHFEKSVQILILKSKYQFFIRPNVYVAPLLGAPRSSRGPVHWTAWTPGSYATGAWLLLSWHCVAECKHAWHCVGCTYVWRPPEQRTNMFDGQLDTVEACQAACANSPSCTGIGWDEDNQLGQHCYFHGPGTSDGAARGYTHRSLIRNCRGALIINYSEFCKVFCFSLLSAQVLFCTVFFSCI